MRISFRQIMLVEVVAIVLISCACYCLHWQLVAVAEAKQDDFGIYVIQDNGLVTYTAPTTIVTTLDARTLNRPAKVQASASTTNLRTQIYAEYRQYQYYGTGAKYLARIQRYEAIIKKASQEYRLDPDLLAALIAVESMGQPTVVSSENAVGLMQILSVPKTCLQQVTRSQPLNLNDPEQNIMLGSCTLSTYTARKQDLLLGLVSYNFGPNRSSVQKAKNFSTLEVQSKVKSYPIKVLAMCLMAKLQKQHGILQYSEKNKSIFDAVILPGIDS